MIVTEAYVRERIASEMLRFGVCLHVLLDLAAEDSPKTLNPGP